MTQEAPSSRSEGSGEPLPLPADIVPIAVGKGASPMDAATAERLEVELGRPLLVVVDDADEHEIFLSRPDVLAAALDLRV